MLILLAVAVFVGSAALDYASARYQQSLVCKKAYTAGVWSMVMCLVASCAYVSVIEVSKLLIIPECLGLFVGTVFAVKK